MSFFFFHDLLGHKIGSLQWEIVMKHIFTLANAAAAACSNSVSVVETFTMLTSQEQTLQSSDSSCAVDKGFCRVLQCQTKTLRGNFCFFSFCLAIAS